MAWSRACLAGVNEAVGQDGEGIAVGQAKHGLEKAGCRHTDGAQALGWGLRMGISLAKRDPWDPALFSRFPE